MKRVLFSFLFVTCCVFSFALVTLPSIFSDNMVLQQNSKVKIWGWAKPFEEITVTTSWDNKSYWAQAPGNVSTTEKAPRGRQRPKHVVIKHVTCSVAPSGRVFKIGILPETIF